MSKDILVGQVMQAQLLLCPNPVSDVQISNSVFEQRRSTFKECFFRRLCCTEVCVVGENAGEEAEKKAGRMGFSAFVLLT